jgi:hypothetical protein
MKYLQAFICLLLGALFFGPFVAEALTVNEGSDGTEGVRDNAQLDEASGKVFCSQAARGPRLTFPHATGTFNPCSSVTVAATDICTTTSESGGCPAAGTNGKLGADWMPPIVLTGTDSSTDTGRLPYYAASNGLAPSNLIHGTTGDLRLTMPGTINPMFRVDGPNGGAIFFYNSYNAGGDTDRATLGVNAAWTGTEWLRLKTEFAAWLFQLRAGADDDFTVVRLAPGGTSYALMLQLSSVGNLTIPGTLNAAGGMFHSSSYAGMAPEVVIQNDLGSVGGSEALGFWMYSLRRARIFAVTEDDPYHGALRFQTGLGDSMYDRMVVRGTGTEARVGIGTTNPTASLDVRGTTLLGGNTDTRTSTARAHINGHVEVNGSMRIRTDTYTYTYPNTYMLKVGGDVLAGTKMHFDTFPVAQIGGAYSYENMIELDFDTGSINLNGFVNTGELNGSNIKTTPTANAIVKAGTDGKVAVGWLPTEQVAITGGVWKYYTNSDTSTNTGTSTATMLDLHRIGITTLSITSTATATTTAMGTVYTVSPAYLTIGTATVTYTSAAVANGPIFHVDAATASATSKLIQARTDGKIDTSWLPASTYMAGQYSAHNASNVTSAYGPTWSDVVSLGVSALTTSVFLTASASVSRVEGGGETSNRYCKFRLVNGSTDIGYYSQVLVYDTTVGADHAATATISAAFSVTPGEQHTLTLQVQPSGTTLKCYVPDHLAHIVVQEWH